MKTRGFVHLGARVLDAVLPQDCMLCAAPSGTRHVCAPCAAELPWLGDACPRCALPSTGARVCGRCLASPPAFDATIACFAYEYPLDRLVQALKYGSRLEVARWLAERLAERVGTLPPDATPCDRIIAMPLHRARLTERGFNQSVEIARHVARAIGLPFDARGAARVRATAPQVDLPLDARAQNVRGAFAATRPLPGLRIAVVDDVMTSGATLDELARTLKRAGATQVVNWVVARTP
jgi:ComF family protein